jgi:hypothetical protein
MDHIRGFGFGAQTASVCFYVFNVFFSDFQIKSPSGLLGIQETKWKSNMYDQPSIPL